jgi:RNA polymerase sigma-70 factor (ECF subfamily)
MNDFATPAVRMQSMSDEHLITLFQTGDRGVFEVLVLRHQERVRNFVHAICGPTRNVDDYSQEIFLKVYEGLPRFRFQAAFTSWLYRITLNHCRDELRKLKLRRLFFLDADPGEAPAPDRTPFDHTHEREIARIVQQAIRKLPLHQRAVITLRDMEDYSYQDIAEVLQCDVGTVKSRLARARSRLRELLAPVLTDSRGEGGTS